MNAALLSDIEKLRRAPLRQLREKYRELFEEDCRSRHWEHVFRRLAWRLQALAEGDLPERARERAREIARDADLRIIAPKDFFTVAGMPVRIARGGGCHAGAGKRGHDDFDQASVDPAGHLTFASGVKRR